MSLVLAAYPLDSLTLAPFRRLSAFRSSVSAWAILRAALIVVPSVRRIPPYADGEAELIDQVAKFLVDNVLLITAAASLISLLGMGYSAMRSAFSPMMRRTAKLPVAGTEDLARNTQIESRKELALAARPIHDEHVSLAVLRFESLSSNEDDQYIASGIASEIIALVTPVPDIRVSPRTSTFQWQNDEAGVHQAIEQFNANFALTGSLQRMRERIRVIARLTDVGTDSTVWTQTYNRELEDLFEVQHEIARSIVAAILGQVRLTESALAKRTPDRQLDAWGLLQKAYHFWLTNFSIEGMTDAIGYLRRAIELAPDYPAPRAALAMLFAQQMTTRVCEDYDAVAVEASEMIEQAYRLAPNDIDVLENAGVVWQNLGASERAIAALRHGIELAPLNLISRGYLAMTLGFTGDDADAREAKQLLEENLEIAPKHPSVPYWRFFMAVTEQKLGNYEESVQLCTRSLQGQPYWVHNYFLMANAHCVLGNTAAAERDLASAAAINPYLTPQLYVANVMRICGSNVVAGAFVRGLLQYDLVLEGVRT